MRWSSSHLLSSFKDRKTSQAGRTQQQAAETPESIATLQGLKREKWLREVKNARDVLEPSVIGYPQLATSLLGSLQHSTADYLRQWETNHLPQSPECDEILGTLIEEFAGREPLRRDVAILASLPALSVPAATKHLASLMDLDLERYLRCIILAGQTERCVPSEEIRLAECLSRILSHQGQVFRDFEYLVKVLGSLAPLIFVTLGITQSVLARSGIRSRLQKELDTHFKHQRFAGAFSLTSWLHSVSTIPNDNILAVLDEYFPSWPWLSAWRPNIDRITQWERGKFTIAQRKKLSRAFELDGPSTTNQTSASLKMAEPVCYEHIHVSPQTTENLERFLDLLYRAHLLGAGALDLFIHLCIDSSANEAALSMVDDCINTGDDSVCSNLLVIMRAPSPQSNLSQQMRALTQALLSLKDIQTPENVPQPIDFLAGRVSEVMEGAQQAFCAQLEKGTGEYMGMLIYELGLAILQVSLIHPHLPSDLLARIQQFPSHDALEVIFDQLQDYGESSSLNASRFKSYLASALGGKGGLPAGSVTLSAIREEVEFWRHPPDTFRKDLARIFARVRSIDYALYTSCLPVMLKEDDFFISEMRHMIRPENEQTCVNFAQYLGKRRRLDQLQHDCWLLVLESLIREQAPSFLPRMADSMSFEQWLKFVEDIGELITPVRSRLPQSGVGLTQERLSWWRTLSQNMTAMRFLLERQGPDYQGNLTWLYFSSAGSDIMCLLDIVGQAPNMKPIDSSIVSYLAPDGNNVAMVCGCLGQISRASSFGEALCDRMLGRKEIAQAGKWSESALSLVLEAWQATKYLNRRDLLALDAVRTLFQVPPQPQVDVSGFRSARERLEAEYETLLRYARELETSRLTLRQQAPQRISSLLQEIGIDNTSGGRVGIPDELFDSVESVGEDEYELSFALTSLSDLQRRARGISKESRMLLVRLRLKEDAQFCIHFSPHDEGPDQHDYWRPAKDGDPGSAICTTRPNLFTYHLGRNLHQWSQVDKPSLQSLHSAISKLITARPNTCIICLTPLWVGLWKPAACSRNCSMKLYTAPLEVRLHNLLVDSLAIDLLLTCVYAAAADPSALTLLPGCPIPPSMLRAVIDSLPPLANLETTTDLRAAIGEHYPYRTDRETLLSWLCHKFRGFIMTAPGDFQVPSMPLSRQFLLVDSPHERGKMFIGTVKTLGSGSGPVFHSTTAARLFLILGQGLKVMSHTALMLRGATMGRGVYCGDDQNTSLPYAGDTGASWRHSALGNMRIMLGCELAEYTAPVGSTVHVVADANRLLVRYVFLLPPGYQAPPRRHVEPAMNSAFAKLRAGSLT